MRLFEKTMINLDSTQNRYVASKVPQIACHICSNASGTTVTV